MAIDMGIDMSDKAFWDEIERQFLNMREEVAQIRIFSQKDRDAASIEKVMPELLEIKSPLKDLKDAIGDGNIIFVEQLSHISRMYLVMAVECLGIEVPYDYIENFELLEVGTSKEIRVVELALKNKNLTPEFFEAWSNIQHSLGYISAIEADIKGQYKYYSAYILKSQPKNIIQEHIYAYWMQPRWEAENKKKEQRLELHEALAETIHAHLSSITKDDLFYSILSTMIEVDKEDISLAGRIYNMPHKRVKEICRNNLIDKFKLPDMGYDP